MEVTNDNFSFKSLFKSELEPLPNIWLIKSKIGDLKSAFSDYPIAIALDSDNYIFCQLKDIIFC